jgi:hypothetical protein
MPSIIETIRQFWNILNMYPEFHSQDLKARVEDFLLNASSDELFCMQKGLFEFLSEYLLKDERAAALMRGFYRKRIGITIGRDYESTILFTSGGFEVLWGTRGGYPVFEIISREAYRDAVLHKVDPVKLIMSRKVKVRHLGLLARWALPYWHILIDSSLFEMLLSYQDKVETWMDQELACRGW